MIPDIPLVLQDDEKYSLIQIGSKTAEKKLCTNKQTDRQTNKETNRHYENNGHLAVNQQWTIALGIRYAGAQ